MRRYSHRGGYGGGYPVQPRSPPRRGGYVGDRGRPKEQNNGSLLVRNIPLDCRPEELRVPFERFGLVRDVYLPKDYYTGEPRGFAFVQFVDPYEASEAQYNMNGQIFAGREITVVLAEETRKKPEDMRRKTSRGSVGHEPGRSYHGHSRSRSSSRSPPRYPSGSRSLPRSRSYSPPLRRSGYSLGPRRSDYSHGPRRSDYSPGPRRSDYSPDRRESGYPGPSRDGALERERIHYPRKAEHDYEERTYAERRAYPGRASRSPSGSRSRSAYISPGR